MPGSRVVHCAGDEGGRMPPVVRDTGGPQGREKIARHRPIFVKPSRQDSGVGLAFTDYQV